MVTPTHRHIPMTDRPVELKKDLRRPMLRLEVKTAQHGMVEFVPADFEIHFGAIDGPGAKIIEPEDDFFTSMGVQHKARRHHDSGFAGDFLPLGLYLRRVEKDHPQGRQFILFTGMGRARHTTCEGEPHGADHERL